jgi:hypothetical protein
MEPESPRSRAGSPRRDGELVLRNEFAHVAVALDLAARHPRLRLEDLRSGQVSYLDPLELESLAWSPHSDLKQLLDPSHRRWRHDG